MRISKWMLALAGLALLAPSGAAAQQYPGSLGAYWADYFERSLGEAPAGFAFAIRDGEETFSDAEGFQRLPLNGRRGVAMAPDSVVHLASISKTITALALLHLLSERRIDLDAPFWPHLRQGFAGLRRAITLMKSPSRNCSRIAAVCRRWRSIHRW